MTDFERPSHDPTADTSVHTTVEPATITETAATPIATATVGTDGAAVPTQPVGPRPSRARWIAAGLVVALVVGVSAIATLSLTGSSARASVLGYVPEDSIMYGEVRMDLPGDQARLLGEFLSHFPGFADQAAVETKISELLDQLVDEGTNGEQSYSADIEPWFEGEIAFSMGPIPASMATDPGAAADIRALLLISVKDAALAQTWFDGAFEEASITGTDETYEGATLTVFSDPSMGDVQVAFGILDGKVAVVGDLTSVKTAVDSGGSGGLAEDDGFGAAIGANDNDHVGFTYIAMRPIMDAMVELNESMGMDQTMMMSDELLALIPDWVSFRLRVEGDALVMDTANPHLAAMPGPDENGANGVAAFAPPSTIALGAANDYGATLDELAALYANEPSMAEVMTQLEEVLGVVGGLDAAISWMGDSGFVVSTAGDTVEGGIISIPTDAADAEQFLTSLKSLVGLGGGQVGIEVREEEYAGTTITIIDLGTAEDLLGMAGMFGGVPLDPGSASGLPEGEIELSYAATDDVVVIGSGPGFVKAVLDAGAGDSLADSARYRDLVATSAAEHTAVTYLDITAIRTLAEGFLADATAEQRAEYEESVKPFLEPLDALVATTVVGGGIDEQHVRITVK